MPDVASERCTCDHCGKPFERRIGQANRCPHTYCGRKCFSLSRRVPRTDAEKKARKLEYDRRRRAEKGDELRAQKREHYHRTFCPEKGKALRAKRKAAGHDHSAYCRDYYSDPKKKAAKTAYDRERKAKERYGDMWEAAIALQDLTAEVIKQQPDKYERMKARGYYDRSAQQRRRDAGINRH
jgi:hypothetical protein